MIFGSLFSGIGLGDLGAERAGWTCAFQVEIDPWCQKVLAHHWPEVPRFADVRGLDSSTLPKVDALIGGFPCQDISVAGRKAGIHGEKSGLWFEYHRLIRELRPRVVIIENVGRLRSAGLGDVLRSLADIGYDAEWDVLSAADLGAPHIRPRCWIVAYPHGERRAELGSGGLLDGERPARGGDSDGRRADLRVFDPGFVARFRDTRGAETWPRAEPGLGRAPDGRSRGVDRHRAPFTTPTASSYGASGNARGHPERRRLSLDSMARLDRWTQPVEPWERGVPRAIPSPPRGSGAPARRKALGNAMVPLMIELICARISEIYATR